MKILNLTLFSFFLLFHFNVLAQEINRCHTAHKVQEVLENHPEIAEQRQILEHETQAWIQQNRTNPREIITLPVVVHVIWRTPSHNISDAQIQSQIDILNQDYRRTNVDAALTPAPFALFAADTEIQFALASLDPEGNPTNGITRTQTNVNEIGSTQNYFKTNSGGIDPWDNSNYINIWVCELSSQLLGFAWPPGVAWPQAADGMVIAPQYFGNIGTAVPSAPYNLGRTATHEMGHYLNLEHVWGASTGGCNQDDFITDTPLQDGSSAGCPSFPETDACSPTGAGIMFMNYMDYTNDACMNMFTEGQKERMLAAINGPRATLLSSPALSNHEILTDALNIFPNPASDIIQIKASEEMGTKPLSVSIINIQGKIFSSSHTSFAGNKTDLDVSQLASGMYFIRIQMKEKTLVSKFIKQ